MFTNPKTSSDSFCTQFLQDVEYKYKIKNEHDDLYAKAVALERNGNYKEAFNIFKQISNKLPTCSLYSELKKGSTLTFPYDTFYTAMLATEICGSYYKEELVPTTSFTKQILYFGKAATYGHRMACQYMAESTNICYFQLLIPKININTFCNYLRGHITKHMEDARSINLLACCMSTVWNLY